MSDTPSGASSRLVAALADRYRLERELGQGGMATVYLAEDLKHHRRVAVKVLRPDLAATMGAERFEREIQVAARLQHPHILGVLDSGEAGGFFYYVMPYVEGETLRERITRSGELPITDALRLLGEITEALATAHRGGVVHRDIKPENILLSGRHALVMDFGVAKAVTEASGRQQLTTAGVALGTPAYMAPEQATADPQLDHRVDIYALGVLAYEMLTGYPPFHGLTPQATLAAHVTQQPAPVTARRPGIAPALDALIMRCLAKRPADRYQSAEELEAALEPLATPSGGMTPTHTMPVTAARAASPIRPVPRWALIGVAVLLVGAAGYGGWRALARGGGAPAGAQSVAVLPFENVGGDTTNLAFADGIQSEILTDLTRLAALQVTSRSSVQEYRRTTKSVKQIGAELGVQSLLQGQVQRAGNQVHVTVQLVDALRDRQLWAESYDRELSAQTIFAIQADIAQNVAQALRASFSAAEAATAERPPTDNLEALDWYHRGMDLFDARGGSIQDSAAINAFGRAVARDSGFAAAWAGLASARSWSVRVGRTTDTLDARAALDRAAALAATAPETRIAQGYYAYYARADFDAALRHFKDVVAARPNDVHALAGIAAIARRRGRWTEALEAGRKVTVLDPRNAGPLADYGFTYIALRKNDQAEEILRRALIANPTSPGAFSFYILALYSRGDTAAIRAMIARAPAPDLRDAMTASLERLARHYELANAAIDRQPIERPLDRPVRLISQALNDVAAGATARARERADSAAGLARSYLATAPAAAVFGVTADFHSALGIAEAILGHAADAVQHGERAVQLTPVSADAIEGARSVDALIMIHLLLRHRDDAIRLIIAQAHAPVNPTSLLLLSPANIRLDPVFDGIRDDPRIQALLKDDSAWAVR